MDQDSESLLQNYSQTENEAQVQIERNEPMRKFPQYYATISANLSALAAGSVLGWTSPIVEELEKGFNGTKLNDNELGWVGSFATLGAMIMCIPTGFFCDFLGRKRTLLLLIIPFSIGWFLIIFSSNLLMLYFGRIFTGMAVGSTCVAAPLYISEISHKSVRGRLGSYFQLMIVVGVLYSYIFGKYLSVKHFTISCAVLPFVFVIVFLMQPESPIYLLKKGAFAEAGESLIRLRGASYNYQQELNELEEVLKENTQSAVSVTEMLRQKSTIKALIISFSLMFFQQFSGINTIILYASNIFKSSGIELDSKTAAILVGVVQVSATFVASLKIDKSGRRVLLLISTSNLALCAFSLASYFTLKDRCHLSESTLGKLEFMPLISLSIFVFVFSLGLGPIPWLICGEIFAPEIKSMVSSIASTFNLLLAFLITKFYLQVSNSIGEDSVFYFFAFVSLCGTIFIYYQVPETKGKTIREVQSSLEE